MVNFIHSQKSRSTKIKAITNTNTNQDIYTGNHHRVLQLQRTIGNHATIKLLQRNDPPAPAPVVAYTATSAGSLLDASEGRAHPTNSSQSGHSRERHVLDKALIYTANTPLNREKKKTAFASKDEQNTAVAAALNTDDGKAKVKAVLDGTSPREFIPAGGAYTGKIYDVRNGAVHHDLNAGGVKVGIEKTAGGELHFVTAYPTK